MQGLQKEYRLAQLIVGLESTGHYWFNLADWLHRQGIQVVLVNPMTTKRNKENRDNRPSKNDFKDAVTIADVVSRGFYSDFVKHEGIYRRLLSVVNDREFWIDQQTSIGNRLQRALDIVFPEFKNIFNEWNGPRAIATLKAFPLPSEVRDLSIDAVILGWKTYGMQRAGGQSGRQKAAELLSISRRSVGCTDMASEIKQELARLIEAYEQSQATVAIIDQQMQKLLQIVPHPALAPLQAIGLSPLIIAVVLANAGDLSRYEHGRQLLSLAGLNLCESTSGKHKGKIVLSKRGRRQLRKYLYIAMLGLVSNHPAFKQWHAHNIGTLKMKKQRSIFKLIGKLARILIALARSGESFDSARASACSPSFAA
jgi:transposase